MTGKYDTRGFLRNVLEILREDLDAEWQLAEEREQLERKSAPKTDSFSLGATYRGLPILWLNPAVCFSFDVRGSLLERRYRDIDRRDPHLLTFASSWSSIVTSRVLPPFVGLRTRLGWKLRRPPTTFEANVSAAPDACIEPLRAALRTVLRPCFDHYSTLRDMRRGLEAHECSFLIGSRAALIVAIDAALGDPEHLRAFASSLDAAGHVVFERAVAPFAALDARFQI
jgi:hypothetical protein